MLPIHTDQIKRILIRSTNWVGDAIMTTPAIRAIRHNFPKAMISILAKPWVAPIFENNPNIDQIILFDGNGRHKGLVGKLLLSKELRLLKFDTAILLQNAIEAAIIAFLAGIPQRIGYNTDARGFLLTHSVPCTPLIKSVHQTKYYLNILKHIGLTLTGDHLDLFVTKEENRNAINRLNLLGFSMDHPIVGINPGATYGSAKRWFPDRFVHVCNQLGNKRNMQFIIFGTHHDKSIGEEIRRDVLHPCVNLCGETTLREAIALIRWCRLFITNDSGLMHIAASLNIPLIAIFGSTDHVTTAPLGKNSRIVRVPVACSPCLKTECPTDHRCMKAVTPEMVCSIAELLLES